VDVGGGGGGRLGGYQNSLCQHRSKQTFNNRKSLEQSFGVSSGDEGAKAKCFLIIKKNLSF
jgi:hypothetical protein